MKAAYFKKHGELNEVEIGELETPELRPNDVLIETRYGALNHLDLFVIRGWAGLKLALPHVIGADGSGIIKEVGSEVTTVAIGEKVTINPTLSCGKCQHCLSGNQVFCKEFSILGENRWGTFSEFIKIPEVNVLKVPNNFPLDKAAAAPLTFLTAYRMLITQGRLTQGDYVFIHGAGGGVSSAAIQIAKLYGATVITSTSTPEKIEKAKSLGADHVINYMENKDFSKYVYSELTHRRGIDIVIDSVGQATFPVSLRLCRPGGRIVTCGVTSGPTTQIDLRNIFWKHLEIKGSTMGNQKEYREVMDLIFQNKLNPIVDKTFPLDRAREALEYLGGGIQFGKVLLQIL